MAVAIPPRMVRVAAVGLAIASGCVGLLLLVVVTVELRSDPFAAGLALILATVSFGTCGAALALARLHR